MIVFNKPSYLGLEDEYVLRVIRQDKLSGDGYFSQKCHAWLENFLSVSKALLNE